MAQPERSCIVCRKKGDKSNFLKVVLNKNGNISVETTKKLEGRGAYVCKNEDCINLCSKKKALSRAFKQNIDASVYEELLNEFRSKQN